MASEDHAYQILKLVEANPLLSQRELAEAMGVSLGKANYCLKALVAKGFVKLENFQRSPRKQQYLYLLTPTGIQEKTRITRVFLQRKKAEYDLIVRQIQELTREVEFDELDGKKQISQRECETNLMKVHTQA